MKITLALVLCLFSLSISAYATEVSKQSRPSGPTPHESLERAWARFNVLAFLFGIEDARPGSAVSLKANEFASVRDLLDQGKIEVKLNPGNIMARKAPGKSLLVEYVKARFDLLNAQIKVNFQIPNILFEEARLRGIHDSEEGLEFMNEMESALGSVLASQIADKKGESGKATDINLALQAVKKYKEAILVYIQSEKRLKEGSKAPLAQSQSKHAPRPALRFQLRPTPGAGQ